MRNFVDAVFNDSRIQKAFRFITAHEAEIETDQIRLTQIAAPPFGEDDRGRAFAEELAKAGMRNFTDTIGNVIAGYDGLASNPVVVGAHLDTVFPASTPLELQRRGRTLILPGISDNGCGIVALLWAAKAAKRC